MDKETDDMVYELAIGIIQRHGLARGPEILAVLGAIAKVLEGTMKDEDLMMVVLDELPLMVKDIKTFGAKV